MNTRSIVVLGLSGILAISACSSASDERSKGQANATANGKANTNAIAVSNGAEIPPAQRVDANTVATASTDALTAPGEGRLEELRKGGEGGPNIDPSALALKNARPAPDNSTFASYLTDAGYEIRTFKNHPQLLKVEKKITSDGKQSLKVFLRSGKVVELSGESINPLATAPASFILERAGVQPQPPAQRPPAGAAPVKKSGE